MICVWPRVKSAEPCVRGATPTSHVTSRTSSAARPSRRLLSTGIFARAARERQSDGLDEPVEEQLALRRLELLRVLLGLRQRAEVVLELLSDVALDDLQARLLEGPVQRRAHLDLAQDVVLARVHAQLGRQLVGQLLDDRGRLAQALGLDALADPAR